MTECVMVNLFAWWQILILCANLSIFTAPRFLLLLMHVSLVTRKWAWVSRRTTILFGGYCQLVASAKNQWDNLLIQKIASCWSMLQPASIYLMTMLLTVMTSVTNSKYLQREKKQWASPKCLQLKEMEPKFVKIHISMWTTKITGLFNWERHQLLLSLFKKCQSIPEQMFWLNWKKYSNREVPWWFAALVVYSASWTIIETGKLTSKSFSGALKTLTSTSTKSRYKLWSKNLTAMATAPLTLTNSSADSGENSVTLA